MTSQEFIWGLSLANLLLLLGVVLQAGRILKTVETVTDEVAKLRARSDLHGDMLARAITQLDGLEQRVERLERRQDGT